MARVHQILVPARKQSVAGNNLPLPGHGEVIPFDFSRHQLAGKFPGHTVAIGFDLDPGVETDSPVLTP